MSRKILLLATIIFIHNQLFAQSKEEFIDFLRDMQLTLTRDTDQNWESVDKTELLDSIYIHESPGDEAIKRAKNYSNSLYFQQGSHELYSYGEYPFGTYFFDSMLVTLEDGQEFFTSISDESYFSVGEFDFHPDTLSSPLLSIKGKVRYWYPEDVKVFVLDKEAIGTKQWKEGYFAELESLEENYYKVNIGPGDSLDYDKYYSTGCIEMRAYALNDDNASISTSFGTSLYSMTGVDDMIERSIEHGMKNKDMDGEALSKHMVELIEKEYKGVSYASSLEGTPQKVVVAIRPYSAWTYIDDSVTIVPKVDLNQGWQRQGELILNKDQVHIDFRELSPEELKKSCRIKAYNYFNQYFNNEQPVIDLALPWYDNAYHQTNKLDVSIEGFTAHQKKKKLETEIESSGSNTLTYYGFYAELEGSKEKATRVLGEVVFDYPLNVEMEKLSAQQYELKHSSIITLMAESLGFEYESRLNQTLVGQKVWAKNKDGEWLVLIEDYYDYESNQTHYCFAGNVTEVYVSQIVGKKETIRIPFDVELD